MGGGLKDCFRGGGGRAGVGGEWVGGKTVNQLASKMRQPELNFFICFLVLLMSLYDFFVIVSCKVSHTACTELKSDRAVF